MEGPSIIKSIKAYLKRLCFSALVLCGCAGAAIAQQLSTAKLDHIMAYIDSHHLAMGSVAIAKDGKLIYQHWLGFAHRTKNNGETQPFDSTTQYAIGSVTKMFTAVMALQLIEQKKLSLNTSLGQFYPSIPAADSITIQMLLGHRSGLPDYVNDPIEAFSQDSLLATFHYDQRALSSCLNWLQTPVTKDSILQLIIQGKRHFSPGSEVEYNNSGYWLLAGIIEKVTGLSYQDNLRTRILEKIGLQHTVPAGAGWKWHPGNHQIAAQASTFTYCDGWQPAKDLYLPNVQGAGDLLSTAGDLTRFMEALYTGHLINEQSLAFMGDFYYKDSTKLQQLAFGLESGYFNSPKGDRIGVGHGGDTYSSHGAVMYFPDLDISICCLLNGANPIFDRNDLLRLLYAQAIGDTLTKPSIDQYVMTAAELWPLLGSYYCTQLKLSIKVTKDCHTLIISPKGQTPFISFCIQPFTVSNPALGVVCKFDPAGRQMQLLQHGKSYDFLRVAKDTGKVVQLN